MKILNWNNVNSTYPSKNFSGQPCTYIGQVNPREAGYEFTSKDKWIQKEGISNGTVINVSDLSTLASVMSSATANSVIKIAAGTYRNFGNISYPAGKSLTIIGETDANGKNLVNIDGSLDLVGAWTLSGGKYYQTVTPFVDYYNSNPVEEPAGYYPLLVAQVWKNDVPMRAMPDLASVNANDKFYFDNSTNRVWLNYNPTETISYSPYRTFLVHQGYVHNFIMKNLNFKKYSGNRQVFLLGKGLEGGDLYQDGSGHTSKHWYFENINFSNCRGMLLRTGLGSMVKNCKSTDNGLGGFASTWKQPADGDFPCYTHFIGCTFQRNGWAGGAGEYSEVACKIAGAWRLRIKDCYFGESGHTVLGDISAPGIWFDFCKYIDIQNCTFYKNNGSGVFFEISYYTTLQKSKLLRNGQYNDDSEVLNSNTRYSTITDNYIEINSPQEVNWLKIWELDRGNDVDTNIPPDFGLRANKDLVFQRNTVKVYTGNYGLEVSYQKSDWTNPAYKKFTGYNIVISNNTYFFKSGGQMSRFHFLNNPDTYAETQTNLAGTQALTDASSVSFGWEANSTATTF
jgi:hypothetical protein